jgi:serine/threonine-protein kinase
MLRRPTAIKLLLGDGTEEQLRRFEKEVQLTARLAHPNTISIYDYGRTPDGTFYYAMELLEGLTLEQLVERHGPQPASRVIHILLQVCGALTEAHGIALIHRDIKPANLFFCRRADVPDFVKVLDFGLVREIHSGGGVTRSNINAIVGTPLYLSPEAIVSPATIDARADLYALGCVAYFLVTGTPPFQGASIVEVCGHHLHTPPEPPSLRTPLAADFERVILACLAKDPNDRPQTARALAEALKACEDSGKWSETEAESWWQHHSSSETKPARTPSHSGSALRQTVCCADLEQRLARDEREA